MISTRIFHIPRRFVHLVTFLALKIRWKRRKRLQVSGNADRSAQERKQVSQKRVIVVPWHSVRPILSTMAEEESFSTAKSTTKSNYAMSDRKERLMDLYQAADALAYSADVRTETDITDSVLQEVEGRVVMVLRNLDKLYASGDLNPHRIERLRTQ